MSRGTKSGGKIHGCAPGAMLVAQGMWSPIMENLTVPPKLETLFAEANNEGARLHSDSWGAAKNFGSYDGFAIQVDEYTWAHPEFLPIFAAGNSGVDANKDGRIDENSIGSPGTAKNALTVGASENTTKTGGIQVPIKNLRSASTSWPADPIQSDFISDNANGVAMFSSRGPTQDGRVKPDVVAPGTNILSTRSHIDGASPLWGAYNTEYAWSGGTSMATPLTAGAAALARQFFVQKGLNPSGALVKAMLIHSADDLFPGQFGLVGAEHGQEILTLRPNNDEGFGRVDVSNFAAGDSQYVDESVGVAQGEAKSANAVLAASGKVWATLVYTDAPGTSAAAKALVNDLDLEVVKPNGEVISKSDHTNNVKMIEITDAQAGTYTVRVTGTKIPQGKNGKQPYALIISTK
jgi:subtilisin family serine protease